MHIQGETNPDHPYIEHELATPGELMSRFPLTEKAVLDIKQSRAAATDVLNGGDSRLMVIVGPCSMDANVLTDGTPAVVEYAKQFMEVAERPDISRNLLMIMRAPVSKPRSGVGQSGLSQTDPERAYELTHELANMGVPLAMELMSRDDADYYHQALTLGWVGARNVEDTTIRHIASDLDLPVLFKNSTNGSMVPAENAIATAAESHLVRRMRPDGRVVMRRSSGNPQTGIIFRGGNVTTPDEFAQQFVRLDELEYPLVVDCSHGNSAAFGEGKKTPEAQLACVKALRNLILSGNVRPNGIMLESYLLAGSDTTGNTPGMSLTDPCIDAARTFDEIGRLARMQESVNEKHARRLGNVASRNIV